MKIDVTFDEVSGKPHISLIPENPEEKDQLLTIIAFSEVSFFVTLDDEEVVV